MSAEGLSGSIGTPSSAAQSARQSLAFLIAGSVAAALPLAVAARAEPKQALVAAGTALAIAALASVWAIAKERVADLLLLVAVAFMALPVDNYFAYRPHVGGWPGLRLSAADLALVALGPVLLVGWTVGRVRNRLPASVLWCYGLLLAQYGISMLNAADPALSGLETASALHALFIAFFVAAAFRADLVRPVIALIALQVILHTGFAVAQAVTGRPIGSGWFKGATVVAETLATGTVRIRPSGLFDHPIVFADMLMLSIPMLVAGLCLAGGRLWRMGLVVALACGGVGLTLTLSRGAWISSACAALVFGILAMKYPLPLPARRHIRRIAIGAAIAGVIALPFLAPRVYERLAESNEGNLGVRFELNTIALNMVAAHPLTGVGLNNFIPVMNGYDPTNVSRRFPATVHNIYLLEAAEAGIPGLIAFLGVFAAILISGFRRLSEIDDDGNRWLAIALLAGLVGFLISQLADFSHRLEPLRSLLWMNIGLLFALARRRHQRRGAEPRSRR